jgi:Zn-dependent metalloprotease
MRVPQPRRRSLFSTSARLALLIAVSLEAASEPARADVERLMRGLKGAKEDVRLGYVGGRDLSYISAPPGGGFAAKSVVGPADAARDFLLDNASAFGIRSDRTGFKAKSDKKSGAPRAHVRLQQTYASFPVFGAEAIVQLGRDNQVEYALVDLLRDTAHLEGDASSIVPKLDADQAIDAAIAAAKQSTGRDTLGPSDTPQLMIYSPEVVGETGPGRLAWVLKISDSEPGVFLEQYIVSAHDGHIALHFSLLCHVKNREVYDANETFADPGTLVRREADPPSLIEDANDAYEFLGDSYDFYLSRHGRDSVDNAGLKLQATVRYCEDTCQNAYWVEDRMFYGPGYTTDDVVGHEMTHGVTQFSSGLLYLNESSSINESFSDVWGEFIDLTNGRGNDVEQVKWLVGEELPAGAIRSMKDPTQFEDPDSTCSPLWTTTRSPHVNGGVNNKLCYLLTDGDTFNGRTISGMGIEKVAQLYYEVQVNTLIPAATYLDLYHALTQAAINLGFSEAEKANLEEACKAVAITETTSCKLPYAPVFTENQKITASDAAEGDFFGLEVALSEDTMLVGAVNDDDGGANSGSAYVFVRSGGVWTQQQKLTPSDAAAGDQFGYSVAVSGDTAIIGANGKGASTGSAYVFVRNNGVWTQEQKLTATNAQTGDQFGYDVAVLGDTAIVGSIGSGAQRGGGAFVYVRSGNVWTLQQLLEPSDNFGFFFGWSVALSGETALVGRVGGNDAGVSSGSAYVFVRSGTVWTQQQKLTASDAAANDEFGRTVSVSEDTAIIGARGDDGLNDVLFGSGSAYIFVRSGTVWTQQQKLIASDARPDDAFGWSVSVSGDRALVGAFMGDSGNDVGFGFGVDPGSAYLFVRNGNVWTQQFKLLASDYSSDDRFGVNVAISDDTALVGAFFDNDAGGDSGSAYIFSPEETPPNATAITPLTSSPTSAPTVPFNVTFDEPVNNFNDAADITLNHSGTASFDLSIEGGPTTFTVNVNAIFGQGSFTLAVNTGSDVQDTWGNALASSVTSAPVTIEQSGEGEGEGVVEGQGEGTLEGAGEGEGQACVSAPYPSNDPVYQQVIALDDFCCTLEWDFLCQDQYDSLVLQSEGEGAFEGATEGQGEGAVEGATEGQGEGIVDGEGEGLVVGEGEGDPAQYQSADRDSNNAIDLTELLRVIQFFNALTFHCESGTEDGYAPGPGDQTCTLHSTDYDTLEWQISLSELLRLIQFYNLGNYIRCPQGGTEDGFCANSVTP